MKLYFYEEDLYVEQEFIDSELLSLCDLDCLIENISYIVNESCSCYICPLNAILLILYGKIVDSINPSLTVYNDTLSPMYRSIIGLFDLSKKILPVKINCFNSLYCIEYIDFIEDLWKYLSLNKAIIIHNISDEYGSFPVNYNKYYSVVKRSRKNLSILLDIDNPFIVKHLPIVPDVLIFRLKQFLPQSDVIETMVCIHNRFGYLTNLLEKYCSHIDKCRHEEKYLKTFSKIIKKRDYIHKKILNELYRRRYNIIAPLPYSSHIVFCSSKDLPQILEGVVFKIFHSKNCYSILTTGYENQKYINKVLHTLNH